MQIIYLLGRMNEYAQIQTTCTERSISTTTQTSRAAGSRSEDCSHSAEKLTYQKQTEGVHQPFRQHIITNRFIVHTQVLGMVQIDY